MEASTQQPAGKQETSVAAAKATAMAMAMDGNRKCHALLSRNLVATALVLAAEDAAALIADDADGGNSGVAIVGRASLVAGGGLVI